MDLFKLTTEKNAQIFDLNVNNYEFQTKKAEPYFVVEGKEKKYYAVCPECNNPIIIINLYNDKKVDETGRTVRMHGRHVRKDVKGIAKYSEGAYGNCSLANPATFSCLDKHTDKNRANEIVTIMKLFPEILLKFVREIIGIDLSEQDFNTMVRSFISAKGYYYRYVTRWNLPYSFINMQNQISLFGKSIYSNEIENVINGSQHFKVFNNKITRKDINEFVEIYFYFKNHRIEEYEETIEMIIDEKIKGEIHNILTKKIIVNKNKFTNFINRASRIRKITENLSCED